MVIAYIAMKMCSRRQVKVQRRDSIKHVEPQFAANPDEAKDIFQGRRRKQNGADQVGEVTSAGDRGSSTPAYAEHENPTEQHVMRQEAVEIETERQMIPSER